MKYVGDFLFVLYSFVVEFFCIGNYFCLIESGCFCFIFLKFVAYALAIISAFSSAFFFFFFFLLKKQTFNVVGCICVKCR